MIVVGGFGFILAWCLAPLIIKGAKTVFSLFYVFMVLALSVTYGLPLLFAILPYIVGFVGFVLLIFIAYCIYDTVKERKTVNSKEYQDKKQKDLTQWNARKEIAKNRLLENGEEVTEHKVVMGACDVTRDEADKFIERQAND